jgi:hypothetical protein
VFAESTSLAHHPQAHVAQCSHAESDARSVLARPPELPRCVVTGERLFAILLGLMRRQDITTTRDIGMVPLGYGKFARAQDIVALIPIEDDERGDGRRTYVYVSGLPGPIVASRSERAILADMERAQTVAPLARTHPLEESGEAAPARPIGGRRWRRRTRPASGAGSPS